MTKSTQTNFTAQTIGQITVFSNSDVANTKKNILTASAEGCIVTMVRASSTSTSSSNATLWAYDGSNYIPLTCQSVKVNAGTVYSNEPTTFLDGRPVATNGPFMFAYTDTAGNKVIALPPNWSLWMSFSTAASAGKNQWVITQAKCFSSLGATAKNTERYEPQNIKGQITQYVNGDGANPLKTVFTSGADDSLVYSIIATSDETITRQYQFYLTNGVVTIPLIVVFMNQGAGTVTGFAALSLLDYSWTNVFWYRRVDQSGAKVLPLQSGWSITCNPIGTLQSGKTGYVQTITEDF
jgi:hypothetical protein